MPDQLPPPFSAPYAPDDTAIASRLRQNAGLGADKEARIDRSATRLIEAIRANDDPLGGVEDMLREFALSTKEGLALMVLAEALLRVPDARTADQFIEDKLGQGDFVNHETKSSAFLVNASAWALGMSARVIQPGETPQGTIGRLTKRLGAPAVRAATRQAMRLMGSHFVLGETIEAALARAQSHTARGSRYSFDMLGEGARTADDASPLFRILRPRDRGDRQGGRRSGPARSARHLGQAVRTASAVRGGEPCAGDGRAGAAADRPGAPRQGVRPQLHRRCRGGRPAGAVARRHRGCLRRSVARRLERLRACDPGLSEARHRRDRLYRRADARTRPQDDGAPRQGRLLGHRDQARAGAWARRLSGVHPQGDDRPELHHLCAQAAGAAAAAVSAICHPQRVDRRDHPRTVGRSLKLRIPAAAWHGRGALRAARPGSS